MLCVVSFLSLLLVSLSCAADEVSRDVVLSYVSRDLDLTTHLVKERISLTVENGGESSLRWFLYTVDPSISSKLAYIGAQVRSVDCEDRVRRLWVARPTEVLYCTETQNCKCSCY